MLEPKTTTAVTYHFDTEDDNKIIVRKDENGEIIQEYGRRLSAPKVFQGINFDYSNLYIIDKPIKEQESEE